MNVGNGGLGNVSLLRMQIEVPESLRMMDRGKRRGILELDVVHLDEDTDTSVTVDIVRRKCLVQLSRWEALGVV
jgi:hypothetical protein